MKTIKLRDSLASKLLIRVFIIYSIITITTTSIHIYEEYQHTKNSVYYEISSLENTFKSPLSKSIWNYNIEQRNILLKNINGLNIITGINFISKDKLLLKTYGETIDDELVYSFKLEDTFNNKKEFLGTIQLYSNSDIVFDRVKVGFYFIIIHSIIKTILLWFLFVWAFNKYLAKPLNNLTKKVKNIDFDNLDDYSIEKNYKIKENANELDMLRYSFSSMLNKINDSKKEIEFINENLEIRIQKEVNKNLIVQEKLYKSEKMASMGEMIGNIAHQWRQPLSVISTASSGMQLQKEYNMLTDELFQESCNAINTNASYLSNTIDDFRNFIQGDKTKTIFSLKDEIDSCLNLVDGSIKKYNINITLDLKEDIKIDGYENELTQCLINIFNNSKDILAEKKIEYKLMFISASTNKNRAIIKIKDNGGGIAEDIINRIFEPYFTTKHQSQGTGLGLHMTYNLIVDGMNGTIEVKNQTYTYKNKEYIGAEFTISLPL